MSRPIVVITEAAVALSVAIMIVAIAVVVGFKKEISGKITGFASHLQIVNFQDNLSETTFPIGRNASYLDELSAVEHVVRIQPFAEKAGVLKNQDNTSTIVFKGADPDYDLSFFEKNLKEGSLPGFGSRNDSIVVSRLTADGLGLSVGDKVSAYFMSAAPRMRRLTISGIYSTGLSDFDSKVALMDMSLLRRLNSWEEDETGGFEIFLDDIRRTDEVFPKIIRTIEENIDASDDWIQIIRITDKYNQIFDWLGIIDVNAWIILTLMVIVAGMNMLSGVFILILQRTRMIGILKSIGTPAGKLNRIFSYQGGIILFKGLIPGNILGIGLVLLEKYTGIFRLDPSTYFLDSVPVSLGVLHVVLVNVLSMAVIMLLLGMASAVLSRISPDKAIRFN